MVKHLPIYMTLPKSLALVTLIVLSFASYYFSIKKTFVFENINCVPHANQCLRLRGEHISC